MFGEPCGAGDLESGMDDMFVPAFNESGTDGEVVGEGVVVEKVGEPVADVAPGLSDRGRFLGNMVGFAIRSQCGQHTGSPTFPESLLLDVTPATRLGVASGLAEGCGGGQIVADVVEVDKKPALMTKNFRGLMFDPGSAIGHDMHRTFQRPAFRASTVAPATTGLLHAAQCGAVGRLGSPLGLGGDKAHLPPLPRPCHAGAPAQTRFHRRDHGAVGFGDDPPRAVAGQRPVPLLILGFEMFRSAPGVMQCRFTYFRRAYLDTVMLQNPGPALTKGMFRAKIRQHTLQAAAFASRTHPRARQKRTPVALLTETPHPIEHGHHTEHAPPLQLHTFFFLTLAPRGPRSAPDTTS